MMYRRVEGRFWRHLIALPFIYLQIVPASVVGLCFLIGKLFKRSTGIKMSDYVRIDRHRLEYLNVWEKIGCVYCGFVNGVLHYATAVTKANPGIGVKISVMICDLFLLIYLKTSYKLYRLPPLKRSDYVKDDYVNGVLFLAVVVAANTELYFCGIRHEKYKGFKEPMHHKNFVKYGDEKGLERRYGKKP